MLWEEEGRLCYMLAVGDNVIGRDSGERAAGTEAPYKPPG